MNGPGRRVLSIRWAVVVFAVAISAASVLVSGAITEQQARRALTGQLRSKLFLTARDLALSGAQALLADYPELSLHPLILRLHRGQPELQLLAVTDRQGQLLGHRDENRLHERFAPPGDLTPVGDATGLERGEALLSNRTLLVARVPVRHPDGRVIGTVWVGAERTGIDRLLAENRRRQALACAALALLGAIASFLVMSKLLRPLSRLRKGIQRIGGGDLDHRIALRDHTELGLLADSIDDMAGRLRDAREQAVERARLAHEVDLARGIQQSLLPSRPFRLGHLVVRGDQRVATEVGGDYYDVFRLGDGSIAVAIADVSGKGLAGCLVMSMLSVLIRALREAHRSPKAMLVALDARLSESLQPGQFVTMFYAVIDPHSGRMVFASAGHNDLLVYRSATGRVERFEERGMPLAALRGGALRATVEDQVLELGPGDLAVQFTDGCTEAFDPARRQYGIERLVDRTRALAGEGSLAVLEGLRGAVEDWRAGTPPSDDETLVVIAHEGAEEPAASVPAGGEADAAMRELDRAARYGKVLRIPAQLDVLSAIRAWTREEVTQGAIAPELADPLDMALYEVCANIAEHGYAGGARGILEVWWLPADASGAPDRETTAGARLGRGLFIVRDHGVPFRPDGEAGVDFDQSSVRRRGRGLGLEIIRRVMSEVRYVPGTPRGNLTLLRINTSLSAGDGPADAIQKGRAA